MEPAPGEEGVVEEDAAQPMEVDGEEGVGGAKGKKKKNKAKKAGAEKGEKSKTFSIRCLQELRKFSRNTPLA